MSYGTSELILVDVHSDIGVLSELLSIVDLEAVAYCRTDTSQQEVDVSRAVGGTELDRLLIGVALLAGRFEGVDDAGHIDVCTPAEGYTHESRAVAVAPAYRRRSLLMRYETQVRGGVRVTEGRERSREAHHTSDSLVSSSREFASLVDILVDAVLVDDLRVDVHTATSLTDDDLRSEGYLETHSPAELEEDPLTELQVLCSFFDGYGEEFDFVLLVVETVSHEVPYFAVAILDLATAFADEAHSLRTEVDLLAEGAHLMVATLVDSFVAIFLLTDDVVLELTHSVELQTARHFAEGLSSTAQDLVGSSCERLAILVHIGAEEGDRRLSSEGIHEGRGELRHYIEVRGAGFHQTWEEAGAVYALTRGEDFIKILGILDDEVQLLETPISCCIAEVELVDVVVEDVLGDVCLSEGLGFLPDSACYGIEGVLLHSFLNVVVCVLYSRG